MSVFPLPLLALRPKEARVNYCGECGHVKGDHFDETWGCSADSCDCGSFEKSVGHMRALIVCAFVLTASYATALWLSAPRPNAEIIAIPAAQWKIERDRGEAGRLIAREKSLKLQAYVAGIKQGHAEVKCLPAFDNAAAAPGHARVKCEPSWKASDVNEAP